MNELMFGMYAIHYHQERLAEAQQARLVAQLSMPYDGPFSAQRSNLGAATQKAPAGGSAFDAAVRQLAQRLSRRRLWGVATAVALGAAIGRLPASADARNRKRKKAKKAKRLCHRDGSKCKKQGKRCKAQFCLSAPFTIEARWSNVESDQDTFLFVPNEEGNDDPFPFITVFDAGCLSGGGNDGTVYPFAFIDRDAQGPGDEITTIRRLLDGTYEYWIELARPSTLGEVEVTLRNANGTVMRSWSSPENTSPSIDIGWHVFDINGSTGIITSVDELDDAPLSAHAETTEVCPA